MKEYKIFYSYRDLVDLPSHRLGGSSSRLKQLEYPSQVLINAKHLPFSWHMGLPQIEGGEPHITPVPFFRTTFVKYIHRIKSNVSLISRAVKFKWTDINIIRTKESNVSP